jgi:hypothetical protein
MRTSPSRVLLLLALLVAAPPAVAGVTWGGNLGFSAHRSDQWTDQSHSGVTDYWFAGALHLDASFFTPGTLELGAGVSYLGYRTVGGSASDALNYDLHFSALARTPVLVSGSATRTTIDFTADTSNDRIGTTQIDSLSGSVGLASPGYPALSATVRNTASTNRFGGAPTVNADVTTLSAAATQSVEALNYTLSYDTGWASGDYVESNYRQHAAVVRAMAELATNLTAQVSATYNLRLPTIVDPNNPRYDDQSLSAYVQWMDYPDTSGGGGYSYADTLFEAPGSETRQTISHGLSAYGSHRLHPDLSVDATAGLTVLQARSGAAEQQSTGEQAGAAVRWDRRWGQWTSQSSAGGNLGLYQGEGGLRTSAWAVGASTSWSRPVESWSTGLGLSGSYETNTGASQGTRYRLYANAAASGAPGGWSFDAALNGGYSHSSSDFYGSNSSTNLRLVSQASRSGYVLSLNAGLTDDLAGVLIPGTSTGSLIPSTFNTRSTYVQGTASLPALQNLSLTLLARYLSTTSPGRVTRWEDAVSVNASYSLGAWVLSLYDQVTVGGSENGVEGTQNLIFFMVTRSFGR